MAKRVPSYFEPWKAEVTADWRTTWGDEPPPVDDPDVVERWRSARAKAERDAGWVLWGSGMFAPSAPTGFLSGDPVVCGGEHIIARLHKPHTDRDDAVPHGAIAVRIAECVNALAGVGNPAPLVAATRDLLSDLVGGRVGGDDPRVVSLLSRWIPSTREAGAVACPAEEPP